MNKKGVGCIPPKTDLTGKKDGSLHVDLSQPDPYVSQLDRIERLLKWLVFDSKLCDEENWTLGYERSDEYENVREQQPDISDIIED